MDSGLLSNQWVSDVLRHTANNAHAITNTASLYVILIVILLNVIIQILIVILLIVISQVDSLSAAFPAIQVLAGDVEEAM